MIYINFNTLEAELTIKLKRSEIVIQDPFGTNHFQARLDHGK